MLPPDLLGQFQPPDPDFKSEAADFAKWAVQGAAVVFLLPHILSFIGALVDRYQYHRLLLADKVPDGFEVTPYVKTQWVFAEALFLVGASALFLVTLNHWDRI